MRFSALFLVSLAAAQTAGQPALPPATVPKTAPVKAPEWRMRYFHDQDRSSLQIVDLAFPSARRGVAAGFVLSKNRRDVKPVALITSDGGKNWSTVALEDKPRSLFFLNETVGWMVGWKGLWRTDEAGRSWKKVWSQDGVLRVWFNSEKQGWAVGGPKAAWETKDGQRWTKIAGLEQVDSKAETTVFDWVAFADGDYGTIVGSSRRPRRDRPDLPAWIDPELNSYFREWPAMSIFFETRDGGRKWDLKTGSLFGHIARVRLSPDARGLVLFEYRDQFDYPSEIYRLDLRTGKNSSAFRARDRVVTDIALVPKGPAYAAAIEAKGPLAYSPIPGKVKILTSDDLELWRETKVDYRASATWVCLAVSPPDHLWAATDTGMILELARE